MQRTELRAEDWSVRECSLVSTAWLVIEWKHSLIEQKKQPNECLCKPKKSRMCASMPFADGLYFVPAVVLAKGINNFEHQQTDVGGLHAFLIKIVPQHSVFTVLPRQNNMLQRQNVGKPRRCHLLALHEPLYLNFDFRCITGIRWF
jgi:hypothetical protein